LKLYDCDSSGNNFVNLNNEELDKQNFCSVLERCKVCGHEKNTFNEKHEFLEDGVIESSGCAGVHVVCRKCGSSRNVYNHSFSSEWVTTKMNVYGKETFQYGYDEYTCTNCGFSYRIEGCNNYYG
jgi:hypothetical protein